MGRYAIEAVIGFGGMATVYRASDPDLNRPVAIKVLHPHLHATGNSRQRFLREAQSAASIAHPNVIAIYGVHQVESQSFLVMQWVSGGSLQQRIDREGPLDLEDVLRIGLQIAEGLTAAHTHGVIHRDIKPANILLEDGNRRVLLSDFGLARTLDDATLTASGLIAGTPAYMSPEQARGESIDFRSDIYSLGGVIFAMSTGHAPFSANSTLRLLRDVSERPFPSARVYQEQLPVWFDRLIERLTRSETDDRVPDALTASELIRGCLMHVTNPELHPLPSDLVETLPARVQTLHPRRWWAGIAGLAILVSVFVLCWQNVNWNLGATRLQTTAAPHAWEMKNVDSHRSHSSWDDGLQPVVDSVRARLLQFELPNQSFTSSPEEN
jgi:serine/threonine-protein kinase